MPVLLSITSGEKIGQVLQPVSDRSTSTNTSRKQCCEKRAHYRLNDIPIDSAQHDSEVFSRADVRSRNGDASRPTPQVGTAESRRLSTRQRRPLFPTAQRA